MLRVGAVGDIIFESTLQRQAARKGSYAESWSDVADHLRAHDVMFGNHEGTASYVESVPNGGACTRDERGTLTCDLEFQDVDRGPQALEYAEGGQGVFYSGGPYLQFNYHPMLATDLAASGFDIVSTANNHCLDRGHLGLNQTLDGLDGAGIAHTGTRRAVDEPWFGTVERAGWTTAWVACTDSTNYQRNGRDVHAHLVANCFSPDYLALVSRLAADPTYHAVVAVVHWGAKVPAGAEFDEARAHGYDVGISRGVVYQRQPDCSMRHFARQLAEAGAAAVLGMHPHVLHGWERYQTSYGRETLLVHSLGNFVGHGGYEETAPPPAFVGRGYDSDVSRLFRRTSALLSFGLRWDPARNWAVVDSIGHVPLFRRLSDLGHLEPALAAENSTTYEIHVETPPVGSEEDAFVTGRFGPLRNYSMGSGTFDGTAWEVARTAAGGFDASNVTLHALSSAPVTSVDAELYPPTRHINEDGSRQGAVATEQCLKCEAVDDPFAAGCRWCQHKPFKYCTGPDSSKVLLGSALPWDECLALAAHSDCSDWVYAGGSFGKCTCMRKGEACNLARSVKGQAVYRRQC